jgi:creatinine amidohydrolase
MRPYILAETNWKSIKERKIELAVLPWGATEAHNYHLPYGTDIMESEFFAAEAAKRVYDKGMDIIVLPAVPFGVNTGQTDITLDINLNPSTQFAILDDILATLNRQKIYKFILLNSHGGNDFKPMLRELGLKYPDMLLINCDWFRSVDKSLYFENEGDHADEMETSLMLYLAPEFMLPIEEAGNGIAKQIKIKGIREGWAWTERKWSQVTTDTGIGNPKKASREKGEKYFHAVVDKLTQLFLETLAVDKNDLYE